MNNISQSVVRKDHSDKVSGRSMFVADYPQDGVLHGKLLRSEKARAKILRVRVPELPEGYHYVDAGDIPGDNNVDIVLDDNPVFCRDTVEYIGEPVAMICGPDERETEKLRDACEIEYEELEPVLDVRKADYPFAEYSFGHGDTGKAFSEADKVYEEEFMTGYQEQAYLETQGMVAVPEEDGRMFIHGSAQCAYYIHGAVARVLGCGPEGLHVRQDVTGGAFGGKEDFPSILASQVAVAARKCGRPVRCVFGRREDIEFTTKRHPSICRYKVAVRSGKVTAMDIDVTLDSGAYSTVSPVVLQRGIVAAMGVYNVPNIHIHGRALRTNTVPCGAFRGFGGPQTFFAVEMMMDHIARDLGKDPLDFKIANLAREGDVTSTLGRYWFPVPLPEMIEKIDRESDFRKKRAEYSAPQSGRYRRGIGLSLHFHGAGFNGTAERDMIKPVTRLHKYADGTVEILISSGEIGQGLRTTFPKIVANELGISMDKVFFEHPDTARVPDSGPTVASRSMMIVGELLRRAAIKLRGLWIDGEEQEVEERFIQPEFVIPLDMDKFEGDVYPTYAWAVNVIELEIDTFTGIPKVLGAYGCFDLGTPIDEKIVTGQMEGGFLQGIGHASIENLPRDSGGRIRSNSFSDYLIPTTQDVPVLRCILHSEKYPYGPYGAKGGGEAPLVGATSAYLDAVEQALGGRNFHHVPFTPEDILEAIGREGL